MSQLVTIRFSGDRRIKRPKTAGRTARLFLLQERHGVAGGKLFKKGFEDLGLVVDREMEPIQPVGQKLIDDDFDDRRSPTGMSGLGRTLVKGASRVPCPPAIITTGRFRRRFGLIAAPP